MLTYAAGFNYRWHSENFTVPNVISGQPVETNIRIRTTGMIYSLSIISNDRGPRDIAASALGIAVRPAAENPPSTTRTCPVI